jgi:hypothetical protein
MAALYTPHPPALQVAFSDLSRQAEEQPFLLTGTPGSVGERTVSGRRFLYRQHYTAAGSKEAEYLGPAEAPDAIERASAIREQLTVANALLETARMLARGGYVRVDARTDAILVAFANHGLFRAGAVLVGSHAYGALLNVLGVRAAGYATEDVDLARPRRLDLSEGTSFARVLEASTIELKPVPPFDPRSPSTSWKPPGADRLRVDLLAPGRGEEPSIVAVPELAGHATGLPHLRYLLEEPVASVVIGRAAVIPVRVPRPERLAWHKLLVSQLRSRARDKREKDLAQGGVLCAILADREEATLEEGFRALAPASRGPARAAGRVVARKIAESPHARAADVIASLVR